MGLFSRFPSFEYIYKNALSTFLRFPPALLSAAMGTIAAVHLVESTGSIRDTVEMKLILVAALGLPLFIALTIFGEKESWSRKTTIIVQALAVIALVLYYISLPPDIARPLRTIVRFLLLDIGLHFLVAFLPFIRGKQVNGFWQYNKSLFLRFLISALYSAVMYIGLVIALAAADYLFGVDIDEKRYLQLWIIIAGLFNTWIFLAGIPRNPGELENVAHYPKGLKVFSQYILLPLVILYFAILITYEAKIIVTWSWPKGWVSQLVLWYSVVGILSMLLLHPFRDDSANRWIGVFSKWYFRALVPLVVMLIFAILKRISDYGITENRFFVAAMALGLSIVVVYFIFSRRKDIRIIPVVICCLAFLSSFGPWGAFSTARKSQISRLENLLVKNEIFSDGRIMGTPVNPEYDDRREMSSIISYLVEWQGAGTFSRWVPDSVLASLDTLNRYTMPEKIARYMGFNYVSRWNRTDSYEYFGLNAQRGASLNISDYDYLIDIDLSGSPDYRQSVAFDDDSCYIRLDNENSILEIKLESSPGRIELSLSEMLSKLIDVDYYRHDIPIDEMSIAASGDDFEVNAVFSSISGIYREDMTFEIKSIEGTIFIRQY
jgi:hypothetical protein